MKVEKRIRFQPLVITLESQEEIDELFAVFNYTPINSGFLALKGGYKLLQLYASSDYEVFTRLRAFWEKGIK